MNKDVILTEGLNNIYPLAHSDSNKEVIPNTYLRKEIDVFEIPPCADADGNFLENSKWEKHEPASAAFKDDICYTYTMVAEDDGDSKHNVYPELKYLKYTDNPLWDVIVDPLDHPIDENLDPSSEKVITAYKKQIKARAVCTTVLTYDKKMVLVTMKPIYTNENNDPFKFITVGLRLHPRAIGGWAKLCFDKVGDKLTSLQYWQNITEKNHQAELEWWTLLTKGDAKDIKSKSMSVDSFYTYISKGEITGENIKDGVALEDDVITFWATDETRDDPYAIYTGFVHVETTKSAEGKEVKTYNVVYAPEEIVESDTIDNIKLKITDTENLKYSHYTLSRIV